MLVTKADGRCRQSVDCRPESIGLVCLLGGDSRLRPPSASGSGWG
jgi:hypothetical protein